MEDKKIEVNTLGLISPKTSIDIEKLELPTLSVFLDAVTENASVKSPIPSRATQEPISPGKAELVELLQTER